MEPAFGSAIELVRPSRSRYVQKACDQCRQRRAKCDGAKPHCLRCKTRGDTCRYSAKDDHRRPASKSYVLLLRSRIDLLERILRSHSIDIESEIRHLASQAPETSIITPLNPNSAELDEGQFAEFEGALCLDETVNFDRDGEARYFGSTSGRLDFQQLLAKSSGSEPDWTLSVKEEHPTASAYKESLADALTGELEISETLESHLLDLYFTWEQPWCQVVDEQLFRHSRHHGGKFFSSLLLNCIFAVASRYSDRLDVRSDPDDPNTAGQIFLEKAEVLLHFDLKWPTITTIQAVSILGTHYVAIGADAAGWLHQGMAARLIIDMGLNIDPSFLSHLQSISPEEVELRRNIYWAQYIVDKLSACYTGRVFTMPRYQGYVRLPGHSGDSRMPGHDCKMTRSRAELTKLHRSMITHSTILEKVLQALYPLKAAMAETEKEELCRSSLTQLKSWLYDLPSCLLVDRDPTLPHAYILHMVYHTSVLLLFNPLLVQNNDAPKDEPQRNKEARRICLDAAKQICVISRKYRQAFGSFHQSPLTATHCTLSAALFFVKNLKNGTTTSRRSDMECLETCLTVIGELGSSWHPATQYYKNLKRLCEQLKVTSSATSGAPEHFAANPTIAINSSPDPSGGIGELGTLEMSEDTLNDYLRCRLNLTSASFGSGELSAPTYAPQGSEYVEHGDSGEFSHLNMDFIFPSLPVDYPNFGGFTESMVNMAEYPMNDDEF